MQGRHGFCRRGPCVIALVFALSACSSSGAAFESTRAAEPVTTTSGINDPTVAGIGQRATTVADAGATAAPVIAGGVSRNSLRLDDEGSVIMQLTPLPLRTRALSTEDTLPKPSNDGFSSSIDELAGDPLERSTWTEDCPVAAEDLRYLTVSFVGFDGMVHTGELIVHADHSEAMVSVFEKLYDANYPIEEMRIVEPVDLLPPSDGDVNNTTAFACRPVAGTSTFSQHAYGLAVDINPFQNPYVRGSAVIPPLAMVYADRTWERPGMIAEHDVVVAAFDAIGWQWGGRWNSLKDYQHFSRNGR